MTQSHQYRLATRPIGYPKASDFLYTEEALRELNDGEILVRVDYISLDPAMRGWMNDAKSYIEPVAIGAVMRAGAAGEVVQSKHPKFVAGDAVTGAFGVQEYALSDGRGVLKVDTKLAPLPVYLGLFGAPGMTAYFGLLDTGKPKPGETVVVSGAAGAVGMIVGQIAKIKGCRVVGIAGGPDKCAYLTNELGFDAAIDYKNADLRTRGVSLKNAEQTAASSVVSTDSDAQHSFVQHLKVELKQHCPQGIDVYFDNVGGEILNTVLTRITLGARIVICGAISQYNSTTGVVGPSNYLSLLVNRASMTGMVVFDYVERYKDAAKEMAGWMQQGQLRSREHIVQGLEKFPEALLQLFAGENTGKMVLAVK